MKNKKDKLLTILSALVIIIALSFPFVTIYKRWYEEGKIFHNVDYYLNNDYVRFKGGEKASLFFPKEINLGNYEDLDFFCCDQTNKNFLSKKSFAICYVLHIEYKEEELLNALNAISNIYSFKENFEFEGYNMMLINESNDYTDYKNCYALIGYKENTIRYVYLYNADISGAGLYLHYSGFDWT